MIIGYFLLCGLLEGATMMDLFILKRKYIGVIRRREEQTDGI
jgi:hypothetical protein